METAPCCRRNDIGGPSGGAPVLLSGRKDGAPPEDLAAEMLQKGIQCQKAVTGWSSAIPLDNDTKPWSTYNGILLIKGCTKCPHFEPKNKA